MSTTAGAVLCPNEIECDRDLHAFLRSMEVDSSLFLQEKLRERLVALDDLDARFGGVDAGHAAIHENSRLYQRVNTIRARLEAANTELYWSVRSQILRDNQPLTLLEWLQKIAGQNESEDPLPGLAFDARDELVSGILQLREPSEPTLQQSPGMAPYQPTPVRHILHLIAACALSQEDVFVDLGSGLGHVPVLVSMLTGARSLGIEVEAAYVASAQQCAQSLRLSRVHFIARDARIADLSAGSVFYLYSPFTGSILTEVLNRLRIESRHRSIRICSLGPCTRAVANEAWLKASAPPDPQRIAVFSSQ
jgi:hypothetical protein